MVNKNNSLKEAHELATMVCANIKVIRDMHNTKQIPNITNFGNEQIQFNVKCGPHCHNFSMFFNIYNCGEDGYLLNLVSMFPQDDYYYPEGSDEYSAEFIIKGAPFLCAHVFDKPIAAHGIDEAIDVAIEYVIESIDNIVAEAMGLSGL